MVFFRDANIPGTGTSGRQNFFYGGTYYVWGLCVQRASCTPSRAQNSEVAARFFFENLCIPGVIR